MFIKSKKIILTFLATIFALSFFMPSVAMAGFEIKITNLNRYLDLSKESLRLLTHYELQVGDQTGATLKSVCPATVPNKFPGSTCSDLAPTGIMFYPSSNNSQLNGGLSTGALNTFCTPVCSQDTQQPFIMRADFILIPEGTKYEQSSFVAWRPPDKYTQWSLTRQNVSWTGVAIVGQSEYYTFSDQLKDIVDYGSPLRMIPVSNTNQNIPFSSTFSIIDRDNSVTLRDNIPGPSFTIKIAQTTLPPAKPLEDKNVVFNTASGTTGGSTSGGTGGGQGSGSSTGGGSGSASSQPSGPQRDILNELVGIFQNLIVSAAFLMFLIAIFYYVGSGGDSKKVGKAKEFLLSAVTALVALVLVKMFLGGPGTESIKPPGLTNPLNPIGEIMDAIKCPSAGCSTDALAIFHVASVILAGITSIIIYAIPIFALLMTMYAGIQYVFSAGNPKKSEEAVKLLNSSIIGFAVFLMLAALWVFIRQFIGA